MALGHPTIQETSREAEASSRRTDEFRPSGETDSIDLVELFLDSLVISARNLKRFAIVVAASVLVSVLIVTVVLKPYFTGTTKILPPQQNQSTSAALLSQLGSLAGLIGAPAKSPADLYTAMLKVDPVQDALIRKFDLQKVYGVKTFVHARKKLSENTNISSTREGIITVAVTDLDKKRAADLANAYITELSNLTQQVAVTEAAQRRLYFANQLEKTKGDLANAEVEMKKTQLTTGMIQPEGQAKVTIEAIARLQGEITAKTVELQGMRSFATENNPVIVRGEQELSALRGQLARLQGQQASREKSSLLSAAEVPTAGLEYVRRLRDVKYQETIYELLARQLEIAKIDESKDAAFIQVLQPAVEPELKSGPYRTGIVAGTFLVSSGLCFFWAILSAWFERRPLSPQHRQRFAELRNSFSGK